MSPEYVSTLEPCFFFGFGITRVEVRFDGLKRCYPTPSGKVSGTLQKKCDGLRGEKLNRSEVVRALLPDIVKEYK